MTRWLVCIGLDNKRATPASFLLGPGAFFPWRLVASVSSRR